MKRTIVFLGMVCMATSAMAFGGGGSGHDSTRYNRHNPGVDNFGVHIHPDNPPLDIRFYDIKTDANAQLCQEGANVYCCKEGYVVDVATSKCVACPAGSVASLEENFQCTVCTEEEGVSLDKTACCAPADEDCMNPNKECHPDYLGNCGQNDCSDMGGQWCGNKNQCVSKNEECCPNGGSLGTDEQTCCLGGYVYKGVEECSNLSLPVPAAQEMARKGYCTLDIPVCGCDDIIAKTELSSSGKGCCFSGYYDEGYLGYWSFSWNNVDECNGCGYGQLVEKEGKKYCCGEKGFGWGIGPYDISKCKDFECSDLSSDKITQVCCEATSGMKWCASNNTCVSAQASCPCTGTGNGCQKCEDGEWVADTAKNGYSCDAGVCTDGTCGCPDGPDAEAGELKGGTCCWRGMKYSIADLGYTDWDPQVCGCPPVWNAPEGGTPLAYNEEYNQCCVNGYSYNPENGVYDMFSPDICGCPYKDYEGGMMNIDLHDYVNCCSYQTNGIGLWNPSNDYYSGQEGYEEDTEGICP